MACNKNANLSAMETTATTSMQEPISIARKLRRMKRRLLLEHMAATTSGDHHPELVSTASNRSLTSITTASSTDTINNDAF